MKNKPILTLSLMVLLGGFGLSACDRSERVEAAREPDSAVDRQSLTPDEREFVQYASEMHVGEIDMAKQAKDKSTNKDIKSYADRVIRAHSEALEVLSNNLSKNEPAPSTKASWDTRTHMQFLAPLSETQFNQEFINLMIADHRDARDTFRAELSATQDRGLKNYLNEVLPNLENRLQGAEDMQKKLAPQGAATN